MDSFIDKEIKSLNDLQDAFSKFDSNTFNDSIWKGIGANNIQEQIASKINNKIEPVHVKLNNLSRAISLMKDCESIKKDIDKTQAIIESLNIDDKSYDYYQEELSIFQNTYDDTVNKIRELCS